MQKRIETPGKLLNENGELYEAGYATALIKEYVRADIKADPLRIKEWDYYLVRPKFPAQTIGQIRNKWG